MKNTTGLADPESYNIGRGELFASLIDPTTEKPKGGYRFLGNAPDFKFNVTTETLKHLSSTGGLKTTDKEVTISQELGISFQLDEINDENLAFFFAGSEATHTNVAVAGFTAYVMVADGDLALGRWYDIVNSSGERAYDVEAGDLTVTTNEGSPVSMVLGTDYLLDSEMGRIFVLSTSTVAATAIAAVKGLKVTLAAEAGASAVTEVQGLTRSSYIVALKFISINPANDDAKTEYQIHKTTLIAEGDFSLIGDDWTRCGFKATAQKSVLADSASPTITVRSVAA